MSKKYFAAVATLAGAITGAGLFTRPYVLQRAGLIPFLFLFPFLLAGQCLIHLLYAKVILSTVTAAEAVNAALGGLGVNGTLLLLGVPESLQISPGLLVMGSRAVKGWYSGTSIDSQDTLAFSVLSGVRSMNETFPLEKAAQAYDHMISGKARFRVVLTTGQ